MSDSLNSNDERGKTKQDDLNRFGEWMNALNTLLGTNTAEMAERIGVNRSALSLATHGTSGMRPERVVLLIQAYRILAKEHEVSLPVNWEMHFSLSWFDDVEVESRAAQTLAHLQYVANVVDQVSRLSRLLASMAREIERLARENETLRRNGPDSKKRL